MSAAVAVTPEDFLAAGDAAFERGDCQLAMQDYRRAIELRPSYAEAYNNLAYTQMRVQDYRDALSQLSWRDATDALEHGTGGKDYNDI